MRPKIKRNAIRCLRCNTVAESKWGHDFHPCECGAVYADGGKDYLRRVGKPEDYVDISEYEPDEEEAQDVDLENNL